MTEHVKHDQGKPLAALIPWEWWKAHDAPSHVVNLLRAWQEEIALPSDEVHRAIGPQSISGVLQVLEFGARKYASNAWRGVEDAKVRYLHAMARHQLAFMLGENADRESGLPHAHHRDCCALFVASALRRREQSR